MNKAAAVELKRILGDEAKEIILRGTSRPNNKMINCINPMHKDRNPSMNWVNDGHYFYCHSCKCSYDIFKYYQEYEEKTFIEAIEEVKKHVGIFDVVPKFNVAPAKKYVKPKTNMRELSEKSREYMAKRKITQDTLDAWKVKETTYHKEPYYVFQYFLNNQLEFVSYRVARKIKNNNEKGGREKNTKAILWGMDHIDQTKPVLITEGQIDAMSVYQAGYKNVVSVPAGAQNMTWIEHCWEWLQGCSEFILWKDNDEAGNKCEEAIKRRLKNVSVVYSEEHKDANELLFYKGEDAVMSIITEALNKKPDGIIDVSDIEYVKTEYSNDGIETGFYEYDAHVEDWKGQEITVMFGRDGEGKTTIMSQIIAHNIEKQNKVFLYSGEMSKYKIQNWLYRQVVGNNVEHLEKIKTKYTEKMEIKDSAIRKIKEWHRDTFYLFDLNEYEILKNLDKFFDVLSISATKYGVKLFVIDNLMSILEENADSLNSDQANFVQQCKFFAIKYNVHVVLLAHPNKIKEECYDNDGNLTKRDISGSKNISNKADNIISVERNWDTTENKECDLIMISQKDRESGQRKVFRYNFSKRTLRFYNDVTPENINYSWTSKDGFVKAESDFDIYNKSEEDPF